MIDAADASGLDASHREAFRAKVPGLKVAVPGREERFEVRDLSAGGFAVIDEQKGFAVGQEIEADLLFKSRPFMSGVKVQVKRALDNGIVGFTFTDLDKKSVQALDKLVLEAQKRLIAKRRRPRKAGQQGTK